MSACAARRGASRMAFTASAPGPPRAARPRADRPRTAWRRSGRARRPRRRTSAKSRRGAACRSRTGSRTAKSAHLPEGGGPFALSMRVTVSRKATSSSGVAPMTWRAISEEDACPSAQALTSWAKSLTRPSLKAQIDRDRRAAKPRMRLGARVGRSEPAEPRNVGRQFENAGVVNFVQHDHDARG